MTLKEFIKIAEASRVLLTQEHGTPIKEYASKQLHANARLLYHHSRLIAIYGDGRMHIVRYDTDETQRALFRYHTARSPLPYRPVYIYSRKDHTIAPNTKPIENYREEVRSGFPTLTFAFLIPLLKNNKHSQNVNK